MDLKDRERLALSTGIALVGYAVIFLLLMGLNWPAVAPFRTISPPVSVYVNLEGKSLSELTATQPSAAAPEKQSVAQPGSKATTRPSASSQRQSSAASAPTPSQATAIPRNPDIPQSMTSTSGGSPTSQSGAATQQSGPVSGPRSATPGVNYPQGAQTGSSPPTGAGGAGAETAQGRSQTFYGPKTQPTGTIFNEDLAAAAGAQSPSPSPSSSQSSSSTSGGVGSSSTQGATGNGGGGSGSAGSASAPSSDGPTIDGRAIRRKERYSSSRKTSRSQSSI